MIHPVLSSIRGEGEPGYRISVDFVIEVEEDAQASVCKDGMGGFGENVIVRKDDLPPLRVVPMSSTP